DDAELWLNTLDRSRPLLAFVGFQGRGASVEPDPELTGITRICGSEVLRAFSQGAPRNTDDFPFVEFTAAATHYRSPSRRAEEVMAGVPEGRSAEQLVRRGSMAFQVRVDAKNALPLARLALQEAGRFVWHRLRGAPPRVEQALAFARAHARAGDPESVLAALDRFGRERSFLMNVGDRKGEILDAEVRRQRPMRALEIGAFVGYSAVRIARLLREW